MDTDLTFTKQRFDTMLTRIEELANLSLPALRAEHPQSQQTQIPSANNDRQATMGLTRGRMITDIITDEYYH